jgi:hypothetical protein
MHRVVAHCTEASLCAFWVARAGAPLAAEFAAASAFLCFGALLHFCVLGPYSIWWLRPPVCLPSLVRACCCLAFPWASRATAAAAAAAAAAACSPGSCGAPQAASCADASRADASACSHACSYGGKNTRPAGEAKTQKHKAPKHSTEARESTPV